MIKIARINEPDIPIKKKHKIRHTARGVVTNDTHQVYMLYSSVFNDYTFPGGGIKRYETHEKALQRELFEELGALDLKILNYLGYTEELRFGFKNHDDIYLQTSFYYIVQLIECGQPHYVNQEKTQGLKAMFIDIDDVIMHNSEVMQDTLHQKKGLKTVLLRELAVLKYLKEQIKNEKI